MENSTLIKDRILQYVHFKEFNKVLFFENINQSYSNYRGKSKKSSPSADVIAEISSKYPDANIIWILTGEGEMIIDNESDVTSRFQVTDEPNKGIPLIPINAMAGIGSGDVQIMEYEGNRYMVPEFESLKVEFMIRVKGDSMLPRYKSGDLLGCKMLKSDLFFQWNHVYVLTTDQGPVIKRLLPGKDDNTIVCVSDNEAYKPFELTRDQWYDIAIVLGVIRLE